MKKSDASGAGKVARLIFDYLYLHEKPSRADAIVGFGHFDMDIPVQCAELMLGEFAPRIIFTGGKGSGSIGLKRPEAEYFFETLTSQFPEVPAKSIILETRSENTGENLQFTRSILQKNYPELAPPGGIKKIIAVANPIRQRRVWLTCRKDWASVKVVNCPPPSTFEQQSELFASKGLDMVTEMLGELHRIQEYPERGFIVHEPIPEKILQAMKHFSSRKG